MKSVCQMAASRWRCYKFSCVHAKMNCRRTSSPANFRKRSLNTCRLLVGPEQSNAPFTLRNTVWIHDAHLDHTSLQTPSIAGLDGHLYVFKGEISANGHRLITGDSLIILGAETVEISALESADLIFFQVDRAAPASRSGTLSG